MLSGPEIQRLVRERAREGQSIEFKQEPYVRGQRDEFLKDVAALANATGGHLLIGITTDSESRANGLIPVTDVAGSVTRLRDWCVDHLTPAVPGFDCRAVDVDGQSVIVVTMPEGNQKPHTYVANGVPAFKIRVGDRIRNLSADEIKQLHARGGLAPTTRTALTEQSFLGSSDAESVAEFLDRKFAVRIGSKPFYRLCVVADPVHRDLPVRQHIQEVEIIVSNPPRREGCLWDLKTADSTQSLAESVTAVRSNDATRLAVYLNGAVEYETRTDSSAFTWAYHQPSFGRPHLLDPRAIIHPVISLMSFLRILYDSLGWPDQVRITAGLYNCRGAMLLPGTIGCMAQRMALTMLSEGHVSSAGLGTCGTDRVVPEPFRVRRDSLGDVAAYSIVVELYRLLGLGRETVPYFNEGVFTPS